MAEGPKLPGLFRKTSEKAHNPMCERHLTMMTPWDKFEENEEWVVEWFCIDCLEAWNRQRVREGKPELYLGGQFFGKSDREFYGCVETVN
jgi:hypothetical protein